VDKLVVDKVMPMVRLVVQYAPAQLKWNYCKKCFKNTEQKVKIWTACKLMLDKHLLFIFQFIPTCQKHFTKQSIMISFIC